MGKEKAFIFDIDGTLAKTSLSRLKHIKMVKGAIVNCILTGETFILEEIEKSPVDAYNNIAHVITLSGEEKEIDAELLAMKPNYDAFNASLMEDFPNEVVVEVLKALKDRGNEIIIMSGRSATYMEETKQWLSLHQIPYNQLAMRAPQDFRSDADVKYELLEQASKFNTIVGVFDDRQKVVDMWRANGIPCFQVAPGDY